MPMQHDGSLEDTARRRLRSIRQSRGWTIEELARRSNVGPSTISRLETGRRRLAIDLLVPLARALDTTVDALLVDDVDEDVVIRPQRDTANGTTFWMLTRQNDPSGKVVAKVRMPSAATAPEPRVHPGHDWFYVIEGTVRLRLGERELLVESGQAASFDTMTPHSISGYRGPAEILTILDHHGERSHLQDH
jgi:transcriptional regulator with XRE-family HTH domain